MKETKNNATATAPELLITRVFNAPRALVFRMFTEIEHAKKWGGPREYPMTHLEGELRVGGKWRACLRSIEDGEELWQGGVYHEIVPNERLVYTFAWDAASANPVLETLVTITFADTSDGKTKMTFHQAPFVSSESRDRHRKGWSSVFDRLDDYLAEQKIASPNE